MMESLNDIYSSVCSDLHLSLNSYISQELKETERRGSDVSLSLRGNRRLAAGSRLTDGDARGVCETLRGDGRVRALDLSYNMISDEGAFHLADLIQENVALQMLDLMCNNIEADGAERIAKSLHYNTTLKRLRMTGNKIGNKGGMHLASMLQSNSTLEELDMSDCDLLYLVASSCVKMIRLAHRTALSQSWNMARATRDENLHRCDALVIQYIQDTQSLITFAIVLTNNRSLVSINISRPLLFSLQEETTVHTARMLEGNHSLEELHMAKHGMTDWGLQRLCEALISNHSLRYLDLRCNRITRDGARHLAQLLRKNDTLQMLDLSFNRIEDDGAVYLSDAITLEHTKLRALSIQSNNVSTVGLVSLSKAIAANPHLTHVYIWGNRLEEPVCVAFSQLISSSRLSEQHTDVTPYTVDGRVHLAEVSNGLRRHYYWTPSYSEDGGAASNAALTLSTSHQLTLQPKRAQQPEKQTHPM